MQRRRASLALASSLHAVHRSTHHSTFHFTPPTVHIAPQLSTLHHQLSIMNHNALSQKRRVGSLWGGREMQRSAAQLSTLCHQISTLHHKLSTPHHNTPQTVHIAPQYTFTKRRFGSLWGGQETQGLRHTFPLCATKFPLYTTNCPHCTTIHFHKTAVC